MGSREEAIMITLNDIYLALVEIHGEFMPSHGGGYDAWNTGLKNPCGCSICRLMEKITIAQVEKDETCSALLSRLTELESDHNATLSLLDEAGIWTGADNLINDRVKRILDMLSGNW